VPTVCCSRPVLPRSGKTQQPPGERVLLAADRRLITGRRGRQADDAKERPHCRRISSRGRMEGAHDRRGHDQRRRLWPRGVSSLATQVRAPAADLSVKKYRLAVLQARGCAIPTTQAETARIAARRLAALAPRWCGRSVVSAQRSAAVALF
jgi:hypothetical protein